VIEDRYTKDATDALVQQALYVFQQTKNINIADRYLDDMNDFITSMLSTFPKAGRAAEEFGEGVRKLVYQRYSILYKIVDSEHIVILTLYRENISKF
jgi:plasmid stabilization system protein ParE